MSIKPIPPRQDKSPFWRGRGNHLGVNVDRTTKAPTRALAKKVIDGWERQIERGEYPGQAGASKAAESAPLTFAAATLAYLKAGGDNRHIKPIIDLKGDFAIAHLPVDVVDQVMIDNAAAALYPDATAQTKNRQFYTPVAAVLHHVGRQIRIKRPKGWRGNRSTSWLEPEEAFRLLEEAKRIEPEFGAFCTLLLYTGMRLGEILAIRLRDLKLGRHELYLPTTKNGEARIVYLPQVAIAALTALKSRPARPRARPGIKLKNGAGGRSRADAGVAFLERHRDARLFRFHKGGHLRDMLRTAMRRAGLSFPPRQGGFHIFCHTYGTWMSRYGGLDAFELTRTKRWLDPRSADRYRHSHVSREAKCADLLPVPRHRKPRAARGEHVEKRRTTV